MNPNGLDTVARKRLTRQLLNSALWHAARGVPVFRLQYASKRPLADTHAELDATRDPAQIRAWWAQTPWNLGASLRDTPWFCLDIDARAQGDDTIAALGTLPDTVMVISGSGWPSRHVWLKKTDELSAARLRAIAPGVDVKGLGFGYVALPPSLHKSGKVYQYEASSYFGDCQIADCPDWVSKMILRAAKVRQAQTNAHTSDVDPLSFYLGAHYMAQGALGPQIKPGVFAVRCPNAAEHTQGRDFDGSTVLYASEHFGFYGAVLCLHSHCAHVTEQETRVAKELERRFPKHVGDDFKKRFGG